MLPRKNKFPRVKRKKLVLNDYVEGILKGNITILSQAITLIESTLTSHQELAQQIIEHCLPHSGNSMRIGITGVPGVGKSTFIETFGTLITEKKRKLCVLAIDPSSVQTRGSILGDKTRMESLSINPNVFIRPSPSGGTLGGVARKTREIIILCEAAGFNTILIETVGVGQSETMVSSMVDYFMLLMLAGAGDELQGIKRGIMEMADTIVFTKADGNNKLKAQVAKKQFENALHYFPPKKSGWTPNINITSAVENSGISEVWQNVEKYFETIRANNFFEQNRKQQSIDWLHETILENLKTNFYKKNAKKIDELTAKIISNKATPYQVAKQLLN